MRRLDEPSFLTLSQPNHVYLDFFPISQVELNKIWTNAPFVAF